MPPKFNYYIVIALPNSSLWLPLHVWGTNDDGVDSSMHGVPPLVKVPPCVTMVKGSHGVWGVQQEVVEQSQIFAIVELIPITVFLELTIVLSSLSII